jgi:hypothetical protein
MTPSSPTSSFRGVQSPRGPCCFARMGIRINHVCGHHGGSWPREPRIKPRIVRDAKDKGGLEDRALLLLNHEPTKVRKGLIEEWCAYAIELLFKTKGSGIELELCPNEPSQESCSSGDVSCRALPSQPKRHKCQPHDMPPGICLGSMCRFAYSVPMVGWSS